MTSPRVPQGAPPLRASSGALWETRPWTLEERDAEVAYARLLLSKPDGFLLEPITRHEYARAILAWSATVDAAVGEA